MRRYVQAAERVEGEATEEIVQEVAQEVQGRPLPAPSEPRKLLDAHRDCIAGWLAPSDRKKRPLRLTKVHELLKRRGVEVTYATLWRWAHDEFGWRERTPTVRLDDPDPGHEAQVDFGKMGDVFDPITERVRALEHVVPGSLSGGQRFLSLQLRRHRLVSRAHDLVTHVNRRVGS